MWKYFLVLGIVFLGIVFVNHHTMTDERCKDYILEYCDDIVATGRNVNFGDNTTKMHYKIDTLTHSYYEEATLVKNGTYYRVILWGDRDSWLWRFKLDKSFYVDIPYNSYHGKDTSKDSLIMDILKIRTFEFEERKKNKH